MKLVCTEFKLECLGRQASLGRKSTASQRRCPAHYLAEHAWFVRSIAQRNQQWYKTLRCPGDGTVHRIFQCNHSWAVTYPKQNDRQIRCECFVFNFLDSWTSCFQSSHSRFRIMNKRLSESTEATFLFHLSKCINVTKDNVLSIIMAMLLRYQTMVDTFTLT